MNNSVFSQKIYPFLLAAYQWYLRTPSRSLDEAYKAALEIKAIEDEHFDGKKIDSDSTTYSGSVMDYFESDLRKLLKDARMRLTEFRLSRYFLNESNQKVARKYGVEYPSPALILEKLKAIDHITAKYTSFDNEITSQDFPPQAAIAPVDSGTIQTKPQNLSNNFQKKPRSKANTTGVLPRSIFSTITRLQVELDPNAEQDVVQNFRQTQRRTLISVRFILLIIIVPILTHQLSKALVVGPLIDRMRAPEQVEIFLNGEMKEEALAKLELYEEKIKFQSLVGILNPLSAEEIETRVKEKAREIAIEFRSESAGAIKNVLCDILSVVAFIWLLLISKPSIAVLKEFFDHFVYGLSDSAKAFIIILFTDIFVGFHSPHGWEVILEGLSRHWGLPGNHSLISLFIATFPVILDTIFKYWIFRYLNRVSPSAVATYRNMNE
jgi:CemA family